MQSFLIETLSPDSESPSSSTTSLDSITQTTLERTFSSNPFRNPPPLPRRDASGSTVPPLPPRTSSQASQSIDIENWKTAALNALNDLDEKRPDGQDVDFGSVGHAPELPDHLGMHTCAVCDVPTVACCPLCSQVSYCSREHMEKDWPSHSKVCRKRHLRNQSKSEPHDAGTPARHVVKPRGFPTSAEEKKKAEAVTTPADTDKKPDPPPEDLSLSLEKHRFCPGTNYAVDAYFLPAKIESPRVVQIECQDVVDMHGMSVHVEQKDFKRYIGDPPYSCRVLDNRNDISLIFVCPKVRPLDLGPVNRSIESLIDPPIRHRQGQKWRIGNTLVIVKHSLEANSVLYRFTNDTEAKIKRSINCKLDDWFV